MTTSHRICILGGGFGGLYTALKLQNYPWSRVGQPQITLIDQNERFVFLPFLYELLTNEMQLWEIAPTFEQLLAKSSVHKTADVQFMRDEVTAIDPDSKQITLKKNGSLDCDRLVLALGGETPLDTVPGAAEHATTFRSLDDVTKLKEKLYQLELQVNKNIRVVVVGAGPSGVELSCKLSDRLGKRGNICLVDRNDAILKTSSDFNRQAAIKALGDRNVTLKLNTNVQEVSEDAITLSETSAPLPADLVLWTIGNAMPTVIQSLNLPKNERGQILTEPTLQVQDFPELYAIGDLAAGQDVSQQPIPKTAQAAFQAADYLAWNIWASLTGRSLRSFRYSHLGEMLTLGKDEAALAGLGLTLDGPLANLARRAVYLYRFPTPEHQLNVGLQWILKPFQPVS
ncbi:MAG: NAD(P)/FAD-dependent oxidoreductase [Cyanobacteria bacterium P01_F01_bin.42]